MSNLLLPQYLNTIVLYTISDPDTSRKIIDSLIKANFIQEGDQSTMMRSSDFEKVDVTKFQERINEATKYCKFLETDSFTLLLPEYESISIKKESKEVVRTEYPVIARYRFKYDENSKSFQLLNVSK